MGAQFTRTLTGRSGARGRRRAIGLRGGHAAVAPPPLLAKHRAQLATFLGTEPLPPLGRHHGPTVPSLDDQVAPSLHGAPPQLVAQAGPLLGSKSLVRARGPVQVVRRGGRRQNDGQHQREHGQPRPPGSAAMLMPPRSLTHARIVGGGRMRSAVAWRNRM